MTPEIAILTTWSLWLLSWAAAAAWSDRAAARPGFREHLRYRVPISLGGVLLFEGFVRSPSPRFPLWVLDRDLKWLLVAIAFAGFAFAWWARLHLGRLWSSSVTRKQDHDVVDTGPYGWVRHPIYTGLISACLSTAVMRGTTAAMLGVILMIVGFWMKARLEERFLREQLGSGAYDEYRRRVPMLIPFGPTAS